MMKALLHAAVWGGFFVASTATAGPLCGLRDNFVTTLESDYGEVERGRGLTAGGRLMELFASPQGSFTLLMTSPQGFSCVVAAGEAWDSRPETAMSLPFSEGRIP